MQNQVSLWALKKLTMDQIIGYIQQNSSKTFQARMASLSVVEYEQLTEEQTKQRLAVAIATMDEEQYDDYLLELIDE